MRDRDTIGESRTCSEEKSADVQPWAYEVFALTRLTEVMDVRAA